MDLLRRLHRVIRSRLAYQENAPSGGAPEPGPDIEDAREGGRQKAEPRPERDNGTDSYDPELAKWYANLEIPYGSDVETAKKAWRSLMKRYHPDLHGTDAEKKEIANELTRKLTTAYQELEKRLK